MTNKIEIVKEDRCIINIVFNIPTVFTRSDFISCLEKKGFEVTAEKEIKPTGISITLEGSHVGRLGEANIFHDPVGGIIGIVTRACNDAMKNLETVLSILSEDLNLDPDSVIKYYEMIDVLFVKGKKQPWDAIIESSKVNITDVNSIVGEEMGMPIINFCPYKGRPNSEKWRSISIEPAMMNPNHYWFKSIFRSPKIEELNVHVQNLQKIINDTINIIENA